MANEDKHLSLHAVGVSLRQINYRLKEIERTGGVAAESRTNTQFGYGFPTENSPFAFGTYHKIAFERSNGTAPTKQFGFSIFETLKDEYSIWICPNGGDMRDTIFRVGHIGALTPENNSTLVAAFNELHNIGKL